MTEHYTEMSGELELTEGTWLQLMCCTPSRLRCPKFQSNRVRGVYESILEYTGEDGEDKRFAQMGALWSIYELVLSYMIHLYMYPWGCMYPRKGKIIRRLWSIKSTITRNGT